MRVKICGITSPADARMADEAGADAIGMIFVGWSKRAVDPARARAIAAAVRPFVTRVGVFADAPLAEVERTVETVGLDAVQLHGDESDTYAAELAERVPVPVVKAVRFAADLDRARLERFPAQAILLDAPRPGSGEAFSWRDAQHLAGMPRLILAGGLTPENVADGIAALAPYAVDVASGVERAPGVKDPERVRRFVDEARMSKRGEHRGVAG